MELPILPVDPLGLPGDPDVVLVWFEALVEDLCFDPRWDAPVMDPFVPWDDLWEVHTVPMALLLADLSPAGEIVSV